MPELRKDPVTSRWVIISTERGKRPTDFVFEDEMPRRGGFCPFCRGNEGRTPPEILAYREPGTAPNGPGWWIRVVPNRFPALEREGELNREGVGVYDKMNGIGAHEVVVETPDHSKTLEDLEIRYVEEVIWAYRDRMIELAKEPHLRYILIFKNQGSAAGASLEHTHSQIIATPSVPRRVLDELKGGEQYYKFRERCVYCDMIRQEISTRARVISENQDFISFAPFASRFPFETWILPKKHDDMFENCQKQEVSSLAPILKETLRRIDRVLGNPPFNYVIHTSPCKEGGLPYYHWHIEIMPRITKVAGFEWGTGFYINPTPPEDAAKFLRDAELS
ncbi:MAG: galactose-1-phosphate uridylyltransferase [bacterium]